MSGHSVKIAHGFGDVMSIQLDGKELEQVKFYCVKGVPGTLPELTVTLDVASVIYEATGETPEPTGEPEREVG